MRGVSGATAAAALDKSKVGSESNRACIAQCATVSATCHAARHEGNVSLRARHHDHVYASRHAPGWARPVRTAPLFRHASRVCVSTVAQRGGGCRLRFCRRRRSPKPAFVSFARCRVRRSPTLRDSAVAAGRRRVARSSFRLRRWRLRTRSSSIRSRPCASDGAQQAVVLPTRRRR